MKKIKKLLITTSIGLGVILSVGCQPQEGSNQVNQTQVEQKLQQPNVLFIYTDDQAAWALGKSGNKQAFTPHMDALAKQGMMFPNAYTTTPVCSPSRAGLLTSRYGFEVGIDDWINTRYKAFPFTQVTPDLGLNNQLTTWPKLLKQAGYHTGLIGKWHLGIKDQFHPTNFGYDEFFGFREGGTSPVNPTLEKNGEEKKYKGFTPDILADGAIEFLNKNKDQRFALSVHFRAPHTKWLPVADEDSAPYQNLELEIPNPDYPKLNVKKVKKMMGEYLSSVRSVDRNLGRLMAELERLNLTDNTLVIFTSDHGYNMGHNGIWHKGNGHWILTEKKLGNKNIPDDQRPNMYDNSIKVPLIVRWPNVIKANSRNNSTVSNLDWLPTLVDIGQAKLPEESFRGQSILPVLTGQQKISTDDYYAVYSTLHQSVTAMRMYSDGQYKLIKDYINKGRDEFYDLSADPSESKNLINTTNPELQQIINRFDDVIFSKMLATDDPQLAQFFGDKK